MPKPLDEFMVSHPDQLPECIEHLAQCIEIGFDTEFVGEDRYRPDLCLIQLATRERIYLIDPLSVESLDTLWQELLQPKHQIIVHAGREEIRIFQHQGGTVPARIFDLQILAALVGMSYPIGYAPLIQQVLRVRLPKGETLTDWRKRPLSQEQIKYAEDDVRFLIPAWDALYKQIEKYKRFPWVQEESHAFVLKSLQENLQTERWRKLSGLANLDRRKLALVREVYRWREERAARLNRPARFILRDDLIVEIAKRNPSREKEFAALRGLPKTDLTAIFEVIELARNLPQNDWPELMERDNDPPQVSLVATLLGTILNDFCLRNHLAAAFVATTSDLKMLVRSRCEATPYPEFATLNRGWRQATILPVLEDFLDGKKSISVGNLRSLSPLRINDLSQSG